MKNGLELKRNLNKPNKFQYMIVTVRERDNSSQKDALRFEKNRDAVDPRKITTLSSRLQDCVNELNHFMIDRSQTTIRLKLAM